MNEKDDQVLNSRDTNKPSEQTSPKGVDRRRFLGQVGLAAAVVKAIANPPAASAKSPAATATGAKPDVSCALSPGYPPVASTPYGISGRITQATILRDTAAANDAGLGPAVNLSNGDSQIYASKLGTYTKGLIHNSLGVVDPNSYQSMITALETGSFADFQNIKTGGQHFPGMNHTLNGPQGGLRFDLEKPDVVQFGQPQVPPAPGIASDQSGTEMVEHYWGALCRDVSFLDYGTGTGTDSAGYSGMACTELTNMSCYTGPRNSNGQVTPQVLFRGNFPGEIYGPYISQFMLVPTSFGVQPISQQWTRFQAGVDYLTDFPSYLKAQNGFNPPGATNESGVFYASNGRSLSTWTHSDVLYQGYFVALLVLGTIKAPSNPGNPYNGSLTENGFDTFGGPDQAAMLGELAARALDVVWYQKWWVHLRSRPEEGGAITHLNKLGHYPGGPKSGIDVKMSNEVLNSVAIQQTFSKYGTYLLPQAFPEGSPTHPSYPTGHGTVGGACITALKFFYNGAALFGTSPLPAPVQSSSDGTTLIPYVAPAGEPPLSVNGELNKLGHNVSFGHGIHAGIHWRSDTDTSLLLGEQIAIDFLNDKALTYNEPFSITIQKFDGSNYTFNNPGHP